MKQNLFTWKEVIQAEEGHIFIDRFEDGLRFLIMRGPCHLCAYIGIPISHPLSGYDYESLPVQAHGGLTFSKKGVGKLLEGYWWYGWDYGHCDDYMISKHYSPEYSEFNEKMKKWDVTEVENDSWETLDDFKKLMRLAEKIANKFKCKLEEKELTKPLGGK